MRLKGFYLWIMRILFSSLRNSCCRGSGRRTSIPLDFIDQLFCWWVLKSSISSWIDAATSSYACSFSVNTIGTVKTPILVESILNESGKSSLAQLILVVLEICCCTHTETKKTYYINKNSNSSIVSPHKKVEENY